MLETLLSYISEATLVGKGVLLLLVTMSVWSWAVIFYKWVTLQKLETMIMKGMDLFQEKKTLNEGLQIIGEMPSSPLCYISEQGILEIARLKKTSCSASTAISTITRVLSNATSIEVSDAKRGITTLATIGNAAPFIGLFGTVWGIINTFTLIGKVKNPSFAVVAPSLGEALFVTAIGIAVAIPSSMAFNAFQFKIQRIQLLLSNFSSILLNAIQRELVVSANARPKPAEKG
ncbi:MAG: MotA/TolQ/ExbB proton channel family protein [Desulfovibrionaceae bacterium]|nr:MotA/TolQ/ExbB proton channel family protein [Desulfovibrionaceae bacterium]